MKKETGITLVEILVVISISSLIAINLLSSILRTRLNISEVARIVISDIRTAQANSLASKQFNGEHRCGYGIFLDLNNGNNYISQQYIMYVGRLPQASGCDANNWQYNQQSPQDTPILLTRALDPRLEFFDPNGNQEPNTNDITFEPYNGHIRINNQHNTTNQQQNLSQIVIRKKGVTCPSSNCLYICVYSFGRISTRTDQECPLCQGPDDASPAACQQW